MLKGDLLILKLKLFGFHDQLLNWIKTSYLSNLTQAVKFSSYLSTDFEVIPQAYGTSGTTTIALGCGSTIVYSVYK